MALLMPCLLILKDIDMAVRTTEPAGRLPLYATRLSLVCVALFGVDCVLSATSPHGSLLLGSLTLLTVFVLLSAALLNVAALILCKGIRLRNALLLVLLGLIVVPGEEWSRRLQASQRDRWFVKVGRAKLERSVALAQQSRPALSTSWRHIRTPNDVDMNVRARTNLDATLTVDIGVIGSVPRQGYLFHPCSVLSNHPNGSLTFRMVTNGWYEYCR